MTLNEIYKMLVSVVGKTKVAYDHFEEGKAPSLPFVVYRTPETNNFIADGIVYEQIENVDVELYTAKKDLATEKALQDAFNDNDIPWNKTEDWLADERCYMITYTI